MKGVQLWQHPYVDVFKYVSLSEWRQGVKEGDVSEIIDKTLGKKVFKLQGSVSASNYIQIPRPKSELKTLALNGKYIYLTLQVPPGKLFSLHLDLIVTNTRTNLEEPLKVSFSNLFKENKLQNSLQVSCKIAGKWSVICIDLKNLLSEYFADKVIHKELKSINLCANMSVRGVYTSDILYSPKTMPKEIALKSAKIEDWSKFYDWVFLPERFGDENIEKVEEIQTKVRSASASKAKVYKKAEYVDKGKGKTGDNRGKHGENLEGKVKSGARPVKKVQFSDKVTDVKEEVKVEVEQQVEVQSRPPITKKIEEKPKRIPAKLVKTLKQSHSEPKLELLPSLTEKTLLPDPILELSNILSISPYQNSLLWVSAEYFTSYPSPFKDSTNKILLYTSNSTIVAINPTNSRKSFFFAHNSEVRFLALHQHFLVSADQNSLILFWPLKSRKKPVPLNTKKFKSITFISFFPNKMVVAGKDELKRDSLIIFDTSKLVKKREITQVTQQLSDFDIKVIKFYEEFKLVSCGKEGIRFWGVKEDRFISTSVLLEKDQLSCTDLAITHNKAYITNTKSTVIILNLLTKDIESCVTLNSSELINIFILEDIIMTSSADCFVRFWPLDFKEVYMEVQHKSKAIAIDMLGTNAATLTEAGVLISIDLASSSLTSLVKSYPNTINLSISSSNYCIINNSIHVLSDSWASVCEFSAAKDEPLVGCLSMSGEVLACGFFSGAVRVFDLNSLKIIEEFQHLKSPIELIKFSPDNQIFVALAEDGNYSVFDKNSGYQPVKDGKIEVPCNFSLVFSQDSQYFAMICNFSMSVSIFSVSPLGQKFKINTINPFLDLQYAGKVLLTLLTQPSQMNYYTVNENKLVNIKQIEVPSSINKFVVSSNYQFIAAAGPDHSIKIFDLFFNYPCQVFLGHSSEIKQLLWTTQLISLSDKDGLLIWDFKADLTQKPELGEEFECEELEELSQESEEPIEVDVEREVEAYLRHVENITANMLVNASPSLSYMFGYSVSEGCGNIFWSQEKSFLVYTLGSMVVKTLLVGEKKQVLMQGHYDKISVTAISPDFNFLATAEGLASFSGLSKIHIWNLDSCKVTKTLEYHEKTVTSLQFSPCSQYLCSIGSDPEIILIIWELLTGRAVASSILNSPGQMIKWLPQLASLEFVTLSSEVIFWRLNSMKRLEFQPGEASQEPATCIEYSHYFEDISSHLLLIGTVKGSVLVSNTRTNSLIMSKQVVPGKINFICSKGKVVIVCGEFPEVYMWYWADGLFTGNGSKVLCDGVPAGLSFNSEGLEGIVSTRAASIWYIEWTNGTVKIFTSHSKDITCIAGHELIATGSYDSTIRVWNPSTNEQTTHIFVPNQICTCLAFHTSYPYLVAGFADGTLKAFEVYSNKCLGSTRSLFTKITCINFTPDCDCLIIGSQSGVILAVLVSKWNPFIIDFFEFCNLGKEILGLDSKSRRVLASTIDGLLNVWEQKFTGEQQHKFFDKSQEFNLIDFFDFKEPYERTKHVYPQAESLECKGKFDFISEKLVWVIIRGAQYLIERNFVAHQIVRKINLAGFPLCISVYEHRIAVGLSDRRVIVYADGSIHEYLSHSQPLTDLVLFSKGLGTVSGNEVGYWSLG